MIAIIAIVAVIALVSGCSRDSLNSQKPYAGKMDSIVVAYAPFESTALLWIAEDQHFFRRNGLNITLRKYDAGVGSLDGVMNGEADIAVGANEFPLVGRAFQKARIRTIGSIARSEFIYLVGRRDRGIEKISDLKGKRVGTTLGTIAHFYLGRFLELNGMNMQNITLVDVKTPEELSGGLVILVIYQMIIFFSAKTNNALDGKQNGPQFPVI